MSTRVKKSRAVCHIGLISGGDTTFMHPLFGRLAWADYVRLSALHAAHHQGQLGSP